MVGVGVGVVFCLWGIKRVGVGFGWGFVVLFLFEYLFVLLC